MGVSIAMQGAGKPRAQPKARAKVFFRIDGISLGKIIVASVLPRSARRGKPLLYGEGSLVVIVSKNVRYEGPPGLNSLFVDHQILPVQP